MLYTISRPYGLYTSINHENTSLNSFIVLELLMKNARHSNPVNRGGNDEPKKKHVTLFGRILWHSSVL